MRAYIYIIPLLFSTSALAQLKFGLATGYGTYSMKELKSFQQELLAGFPNDSKITESFPGYVFYEASVTKLMNDKFVIGGYLTYGSTGGRIHYEDYSGEVSGNQLVRYVSVGSPLGITIYDDEKSWNFHFDFKPHITFGFLNLEFYSRLGNQDEEESYKFTSLNFGMEPGLTVEKNIKGNWDIHFFAGYNLNIVKGKLFFTEEDEVFLQNDEGDPVLMDFSGFRIGLGISYKAF